MFYRFLFSTIQAFTVTFDIKSTELVFSYNDLMEKFEVKFPQHIFSGNLFNQYKIFFHCFAHIAIDLLHLVGPVCGPLLTSLFNNQQKSFTWQFQSLLLLNYQDRKLSGFVERCSWRMVPSYCSLSWPVSCPEQHF